MDWKAVAVSKVEGALGEVPSGPVPLLQGLGDRAYVWLIL